VNEPVHPLPHGNGKPPGTTSWDGSVTAVGSEMRSYYGRAILKSPVWTWEIPTYLFTGGIAGASSVLHGFGRLTDRPRLAATSLYVGAVADAISPLLLLSDLGRPERFLNMFRVFKVTSPMSVGSWILGASAGASTTAALLELTGRLKRLKAAAELVSFVLGPPLTTYTGALVANTAIPAWHEGRHELPWLFGASASATGGAATAILLPPDEAGPARRLAIGGSVAELAFTELMKRRLGFVGEVYEQGEAGRAAKLAKACTSLGAGLLAWRGRRSRASTVAGSALVLAGGLAMRWSVYKAGFQSAEDPRYTVIPQRRRVEARGTAASEPS
jgi:formate-dependent nitrite reductase membrane component NrfD